jgi:hypothetical protein
MVSKRSRPPVPTLRMDLTGAIRCYTVQYMTTTKKPFAARLSDEAHRLIDQLAKKLGNKTEVIETAVRELAHKQKVK